MFSHLHVHTEYSLLDGMCHIPRLVSRAKELGMDSLAITDHGNMYGAIQFYLACKEAGIKPIIGCEVYVAQGSHLSREAGKENHHLVLLAKNQTGYRNLIQLTSRAHLEGFHYRPRIDRELLEQYHEGLVALTACIAGEIPRLILQGRLQEAKQTALWYKRTLGDFYLEIQKHPIPELEPINQALLAMSTELDIPIVATNDVHYVMQKDASAHDLLLCIGTNTSVKDPNRMKMAGDFFYLKSPQEMAELYRDIPEAVENTERIAEMCNLELDFGRLHLPEIGLPAGKTADEYLADLCHEGLPRYYPSTTPEIEQRLDYELGVIKQTQFANYFLVVWDIVSFVKKQDILYGVRGSAASSIVLHCLGITTVDPIERKLVFERFLNIERKEMPDIDLDFEDYRRDEVIAYVSKKYGQDHVAQIITFGTLGARAALRDVGRALGMTYSDVDRVVRLVPFGINITLDKALEQSADLKSIYDQDPIIRNLVDSAKRVEGVARHASTHAAGVVISREPLTKYVPLQRVSKGAQESVMTQFTMEDIAHIGLLKMDFLGLGNLTILKKTKELIRQNRGVDIDLHNLPLDDDRTFALLAAGETAGVFQLEGAGMRRYIKQLKPTTFEDIAAMVALYRPGPMEHIPTFIENKAKVEKKSEPIEYPHPVLESFLKETYGVIVYQEQVLFIVQAFAGYSLGQADIIRKAMGKKIPEVMKKESRNFLAGAEKRGFTTEIANEVFALIEPFAGYAFNKAHAVSYALIAYQTAYLKANYSVEYMTALLTNGTGQLEKMATAVAECRRLGINVLPPDINRSLSNFAIEQAGSARAIRFGLTAIKNVGAGAIEPIITARNEGGVFKSIEDFCRRADLRSMNKRVLESLIKAGALDCLGINRGTLLNNIDRILQLSQREQKLHQTGQSTMFDLWGKTVPVPMASLDLAGAEVSAKDRLTWEKELMGVYLSEHPFTPYAKSRDPEATLCGQVDAELEGQVVSVAGMVASLHELFTRDQRPFASAILEDLDGRIEVMVWPKVYESTREMWQEGNIILVEGKVRVKKDREDEVQITCDSVQPYQPESENEKAVSPVPETLKSIEKPHASLESMPHRIVITLSQTENAEGDIDNLHRVMEVLVDFPGQNEVKLLVANGDKVIKLKLPNIFTNYCPELHQRLAELVGERGIKEEAG